MKKKKTFLIATCVIVISLIDFTEPTNLITEQKKYPYISIVPKISKYNYAAAPINERVRETAASMKLPRSFVGIIMKRKKSGSTFLTWPFSQLSKSLRKEGK